MMTSGSGEVLQEDVKEACVSYMMDVPAASQRWGPLQDLMQPPMDGSAWINFVPAIPSEMYSTPAATIARDILGQGIFTKVGVAAKGRGRPLLSVAAVDLLG